MKKSTCVTVNGTAFTAVASGATALQFNIGGTVVTLSVLLVLEARLALLGWGFRGRQAHKAPLVHQAIFSGLSVIAKYIFG